MAKKNETVIQHLVIRPPQRKTSDVGTWRNAMRSADNGRMKSLFELFDDLLIDGILSDAVEKRKNAICNAEVNFVNAKGEEVPAIADMIDSLEFEELLKLIMDVRFWGRTGIEFDFTDGFSVFEIPKQHINLNNQTILINDTDETGIDYSVDDNILVLGKSRDYGLFLKTAPFVIWKRGGFGDYAQWLEIFGMPQRVGKYSSYDPASRQLLEQALEQAGAAPWIVIPKESEVETIATTSSGNSGQAYNEFRKACNEETLITILGQTLTTIQGDKGARSLGEVHKEVEEGKNRSDMRFVQRVLNQYFAPLLEKRGFPVKGGYFVFPEAAEQLSVSDIVSLSKIIDIPAAFLHDKFSIPMPADGEAIAGSRGTQELTPKDDDEPKDSKEQKEKKPDKKKLRDFFAFAPAQERGFVTRLTDSITGRITLKDDDAGRYSINLNKLLQDALNEIYDNETAGKNQPVVSKPLFDISNSALQYGIDKVFSEPDFGKKNRNFIDEFKHNTAVFSAFKNHRQTKDIVALLHDEDGNLRSFRDFKRLALNVSKDYNVRWLQTEYNTAVRSARNAVNYRKWLETEHLYPNLEYMESSASHPRASHLSYVGTVLPIRHEWWDKHMPPSAWNCACSVRPTDKDVTPVPGEEYVPPVFQNNPGKTAEFVNIDEHPYKKDAKLSSKKEEQSVYKIADDYIDLYKKLKRYDDIVFNKKEFKSGGVLELPVNAEQNKQEQKKNIATLTLLAKEYGRKYRLLPIIEDGNKNPDAINLDTVHYSDIKIPKTKMGKNAIQNGIKEAASQKVEEVIIHCGHNYEYGEIWKGLKAGLYKGRARSLKKIIVIMDDGRIKEYNVKDLRRFIK